MDNVYEGDQRFDMVSRQLIDQYIVSSTDYAKFLTLTPHISNFILRLHLDNIVSILIAQIEKCQNHRGRACVIDEQSISFCPVPPKAF